MNQADFIEEEETIPPIPPNCPLFDEGAFELWDGDSCAFMIILNWPFEEDSEAKRLNQHEIDLYRPVIAAVAEVAWRKESNNWTVDDFCEYQKYCESKALAWRIWGEKK
jgi:hypothetical protein